MTETKIEWEHIGLERFAHLEDKIFRAVEAFKSVRKENESLRAESQKLKAELQAYQENEAAVQANLVQLQKEREELRERVERALGLLATIEAR
jgi:FtsZ-binding cell division protein ZapB